MTLEELKAQRKAIDAQIRKLEKEEFIHGVAKLGTVKYPRGREWFVAIQTLQPDGLSQSRCRSIINCKEKEDAIKYIDVVIRDLEGLKKDIQEGDNT